MEKEQRNRLQKATQDARKLLEEEFRSQLLQTYDIDVEKVRWAEEPGAHLQAEQRLIREKLVAWIEHKEAQINDRKEALLLALREMAFTALNRFVALKLMEARELVRPCVSGGLESAGFLEFTAVAQGLLADQETSYRLYLETIFEDVSRELLALFDPRDPASLLWPKRAALLELLDILNRPELTELWSEDETLGWVYQYFNGDAERKKMREESSAPRNSRELAIRNQFFTPRYVVEFLTDNTLGRIWYEMRQGNTGLKDRCRYRVRRPNEVWLHPGEEPPAQLDADEALSQEELLQQPVYIPHRPLKDPREIRMLDPACGSMHFGLYAFDLYLEIYQESWEIAQGSDEQPKQEEDFSPFVAYTAGFADKLAFLREVPRLILQHNIHGIDIDPRATQIAKLTLWLRAQRNWQEQALEVAARPQITRSNVVCAEPMPGERELLADFVDEQFPEAERGLVQQLLGVIFDKMQLAGEAGSLLKIEEEIRDSLEQARREWQTLAVRQQDLFSADEFAALGRAGSSLSADLQNLTQGFWSNIEERIYAALKVFAEQAESGGYQRKLFAEDAAQGFAFIDLCRRRYDVALMNPPFGESSDRIMQYISSRFTYWNKNILCAFVGRLSSLLAAEGFVASVLDRSLLNKSSYDEFRKRIILSGENLEVMLDLGWGVLDANVEVASCILSNSPSPSTTTICFDARDIALDEKQATLLQSIHENSLATGRSFIHSTKGFLAFPNHAIVYDLPERLLSAFFRYPSLKSRGFPSFTGHQLQSDRHFRCFWELSPRQTLSPSSQYCHFYNGGEYSRFDIPPREVVRFGPFSSLSSEDFPSYSYRIQNKDKHFLRGVGFGVRGEYLDAHLLPQGLLFAVEGQVMPVEDPKAALFLCGLLNSSTASRLLNAYSGQHKYSGYVNLLPCPDPASDLASDIADLVSEAIGLKRSIFPYDETCLFFSRPSFAGRAEGGLAQNAQELIRHATSLSSRLNEIVELIDGYVYRLFGLSSRGELDDMRAYAHRLPVEKVMGLDLQSITQANVTVASDLISYSAGASFGRWDIRCVTGESVQAEAPDLFSSLPDCPPGQLRSRQGLPARPEDIPVTYPIQIPWEGVLVDDQNHPLDLEHRVSKVIETIWTSPENGNNSINIKHEACESLGVASLRDYFRKPTGFFAEHLKRYTRSRRQAPIYWQLSCGSGSYSAWLYYHRFTQDTLYRVLRDFVEPRIQQAERDQFELESQGALSGDAATRLQETQTLLQDLRVLKSELDLVAPLWNPNLNDGVIINHAILWRITPYTPWQKKCKECWDKLVKGDYDWAHLAFHLWPERVIPKCVTDRSLAIAHGLEERLWQETNNGNWLPRQLSEADLQALISEHSNPAVKSALERFLAAPPPVAPTRTRASRSTRASGSSTPRRARGSAAVVDAKATRQVLLALAAAPSDGLAKAAIADLIGVEANALTAVIKQLKESGQIEQLGERRGARYVLSEQGRARLEQEEQP